MSTAIRRSVSSTSSPPPDCLACAGQTEWRDFVDHRRGFSGVAICQFCGTLATIYIGSPRGVVADITAYALAHPTDTPAQIVAANPKWVYATVTWARAKAMRQHPGALKRFRRRDLEKGARPR